jgi:DNA-binding response OmpR family regulator
MRATALLADALPAERRQLKEALVEAGLDVLEARSFEEASLLLRRGVQLAVCDPNITEDDCLQLLEKWAARAGGTNLPLVIVTMQRSLDIRLTALRAGVANFAIKPAHPGSLLRNVRLSTPTLVPSASRVLVVDDSTTYGNALADALSLDGHDVVLAASAQEARDYLLLERPDVALLDVFLPDGDGIDLARSLRAADSTRHLPLMMLTGRENAGIRQRASEVGISAFASKNTALTELRQLVQSVIQNGNRAPGAIRSALRSAQSSSSQELLSRIVSASGLSEVLGRATMELALRRAGVHVPELTKETLRSALPHIEQSLATFLPQSEIRQRVLAIASLAKEGKSFE